MTSLTREELREQIDACEALESIQSAIEDLASVEFDPGEKRTVDLVFTDRTRDRAPITHIHAIPQDAALAGLRAMQAMLGKMLAKETA